MGATKAPATPDPNKAYAEGIQTNIQYAPQLAAAEYALRGQYDGASVADTLDLQGQYGTQALGLYQNYLNSVDPSAAANQAQNTAVRAQLGSAVSSDLSKGAALVPGQRNEIQQSVRASQAASGNILGNAAVSTEALAIGNAGERLQQQRITNAGSFNQPDNTVAELASVAGLTSAASAPDRSFSYVNPASGSNGQQTALGYYQAALQSSASANNVATGGGNWWQRALNGARTGASEGSIGGPWGAIGGAAGGAIDGAVDGPIYKAHFNSGG